MKKWFSIFANFAVGGLAYTTPEIHTAIVNNPKAAIVVGTAAAILNNLLQSPVPPKEPPKLGE